MGVNQDAVAVSDASAGYDLQTGSQAVPIGYKQTGGGLIPVDWELKQIGDIATVFSGGTPNRKIPEYWGGDIPWITTTLIAGGAITQANEFITPMGVEGSSAKWCSSGTILMAMYGQGKTRGKVAILSFDATINQACAAIELTESSSNEYVLHVLDYMYENIRELSNSGGQENLSSGIIKKIPIPYPAEPEQRAIAKALSDLNALLEGLDRLIAKKRDLKQAAMQQLLTGETRLPGFEGEWEVKSLGELVTFLSGGTPSKSDDTFWSGDIPWISATSLRTFYIWRSEGNVTKEAVVAGSKMAPVGSTLLLVRGSALHSEILAGLVTKPVCFNQDVKALVPKSSIFDKFLTFLLHGKADDLLKLVSSAGNTAGVLDTKLLKAFEVRLPSVEEQSAIATVLSDINAELDALERRRAKTAALKQAVMQELLTGRTRLV